MSVGQIGAMALAAMLSGDMDVNKMDETQFKLVQDELKVYSIEVNTQQDLASVLGNLDLGEGKKVDISSLPKYAGLWGKKKVVTDVGGVDMMDISREDMVNIVNVLDKYMEDSLDFCEGGLQDKVNKLSDKQIEEVSSKYFLLIREKNLNEEEKGRIMMSVVLEQLGEYYISMYFIDGYLEGDEVKIGKSMKNKYEIYYKNLGNKDQEVLEKARKSNEELKGSFRKINELEKKLQKLLLTETELDKKSGELDKKSGELDKKSGELDKKSGELDKKSGELKISTKYINNLFYYINGEKKYSKKEIEKMIKFVDKLMLEIDFGNENERNWETIKKGVYKKLEKEM